MRIPLAIVGNGAAAAEAVLALRAHGYAGDIHLFADNEHAPYNPMLGTYLVSGAIPLERAFPFGDERGFYGVNRVTTHLGQAVVRLDALERTLTTADGLRLPVRPLPGGQRRPPVGAAHTRVAGGAGAAPGGGGSDEGGSG